MTIDVNLIRAEKGGDLEAVKASEIRRQRGVANVEAAVALDQEWRQVLFQVQQLKKKQNSLAKEVATRKKADGKDADISDLTEESIALKGEIATLEKQVDETSAKRDAALRKIGNIVHESVRATKDEAENEVVKSWAPANFEDLKAEAKTKPRLPHFEVLAKLDGVEMKKAAKIAGHRAYYLKGWGAMLNQALVQFGQAFLFKRNYTPVQVPFFMKREWMAKSAELADFEETLYRIPKPITDADVDEKEGAQKTAPADKAAADKAAADKAAADKAAADKAAAGATTGSGDAEDLFMIATSEQPLCTLHSEEYLEEQQLPIRYAGISTCFRREAGSHGKDMRGIFRVHQFEKVEQFIICSPKESWDHQEEMIKCSEDFYQALNIPYRVVSIVAGALNDAAARKYDLEAWFYSYEDYKELVSCSNCTDFQARALEIRLGAPKMNERTKEYVHMLNGTLCATERTMCCLLEHYQEEGGVRVPEALRPYMGGIEFMPYKA